MGYLYKQLTKEMFRNKLFLFLLLLLTIFTSAMFFFVRFSIDGNQRSLDGLGTLSSSQLKYQNALHSNHILSYQLTLWFTLLTAFVFFLFYYRCLKTNRKQIGLLKALGFKDQALAIFLVFFTAIFSFIGALIGMITGYFLSDILIRANTRNYEMTGLVKGISGFHLLVGLGFTALCFCLTAYACSFLFRKKETGLMLSGENKNTFGKTLQFADKVSAMLPIPNKFPLRIALRKPAALLLILIAVMGFLTCMVLGLSIHGSGEKVVKTQTLGRSYNYETKYQTPRSDSKINENLYYLSDNGIVDGIEQKIVSMDFDHHLFQLQTAAGDVLPELKGEEIYISQGFAQLYQASNGERVSISINGSEYPAVVKGVAYNADANSIYVSKEQLAAWLGVTGETYNGVYSLEPITAGENVITTAERQEQLEKEAVSNQTSGAINQMVGIIIGCILLFLAVLINFQDSTHDMLILSIMGYPPKQIRRMLINIYWPTLNVFFLLTLLPSIILAKNIQYSLSRQMNDYIPFGTSIWIILGAFLLINAIYFLVQLVFHSGIKRIIQKEDYSNFTAQN